MEFWLILTLVLILFAAALVFIVMFFYFSFQELFVHLRNYNLKRAKFCRYNSCGFYERIKGLSRECLNPKVSEKKFTRFSKSGKSKGCMFSVQLREEINENNLKSVSPKTYKDEYLSTLKAFNDKRKVIWDLLAIIGFAIFYIFGVIDLKELIKLF